MAEYVGADYGAVGDGSTDDTTALANAVANCPAGSDLIYEGTNGNTFLVSSALTWSRNLHHVFPGKAGVQYNSDLPGSYIIKKSTMSTPAVIVAGVNGLRWSGGGVVGQNSNTGDNIQIGNGSGALANNIVMDSVASFNAGGCGFRFGTNTGVAGEVNIFHCAKLVAGNNGSHGIYFHSGTGDCNGGTLINPFCQGNGGDGVSFGKAAGNLVMGGTAESNTGYGIRFQADAIGNTINGGDWQEANNGSANNAQIRFETGSKWNHMYGSAIETSSSAAWVDNGTGNIVIGATAGRGLVKIGSITRALTASGGNVATTGVGFKPSLVRFWFGIDSSQNKGEGRDNGTTAQSWRYVANFSNWYVSSSYSVIGMIDNSNYQAAGITSLDADGFTLNWSKTGSPTGTLTIHYEAYA